MVNIYIYLFIYFQDEASRSGCDSAASTDMDKGSRQIKKDIIYSSRGVTE